MSALLLVAASVTAAFGYLARRRMRSKVAPPTIVAKPEVKAPEPSPFDGLALALDDVVSADGEERWLAGALVAREARRVHAVLFVAPEGAEQRAVLVLAPPTRAIYWLAPAEVACAGEPPHTLELGALTLARRWRLPVSIERLGDGAPRVGDTAMVAFYEAGARDAALVIAGTRAPRAWVGRRYDEGEYERLGTGAER